MISTTSKKKIRNQKDLTMTFSQLRWAYVLFQVEISAKNTGLSSSFDGLMYYFRLKFPPKTPDLLINAHPNYHHLPGNTHKKKSKTILRNDDTNQEKKNKKKKKKSKTILRNDDTKSRTS